MKRIVIPLSVMLILLGTPVNAMDDINVVIDGETVDFSVYDNVKPYIEESRTLIPIRAVAENLGAKVDWDADNEIATIDGRIELEINNDVAIVDGKQVYMDVPAKIKNSRTFVPLRFVSENMGAKVKWDNDTRTVLIETPEEKAQTPKEPDNTESTDTSVVSDQQQAVYNNVVYMGVKNYGTQSADLKDYYIHRFFNNGSIMEYPVLRDDNYSLQNKLAEGYVYNIKVENGVVTSIDESSATSGIIEAVDDSAIKLKGEKRSVKRSSVYSITTSAGSVKVEPVVPLTGDSINVYSAETAYIGSDTVFKPVIQAQPGVKTIKNFLATALQPAGCTLYVFGGGWNWQDKGASAQATTIGIPQKWIDFFEKNNEDYAYRTELGPSTYYPHNGVNQYYYAGADCSGYIGWTIYNVMNTQSGGQGYVMPSTQMAKSFAQEYNFGTWTQNISSADFKCGDIMSMNGHAWIYLGSCPDGSAVILESTPSKSIKGAQGGGIQLTALGAKDSNAAALAAKYMEKCSPEWARRYPVNVIDFGNRISFTGDSAGRFTWSRDVLADPDGYENKNAEEILKDLFGE